MVCYLRQSFNLDVLIVETVSKTPGSENETLINYLLPSTRARVRMLYYLNHTLAGSSESEVDL